MTASIRVVDRPFVTIVVPTRNRAMILPDALASLLGQDYPRDRYEIVVVDDGSVDGTAQVVLALSEKTVGPSVRLVRQPPMNPNGARNQGIAHANGSLIAFFDDDEFAPPGWVSALVDASNRYPQADCFGGPYDLRFEGKPPRLCPRCVPEGASRDLGEQERFVDWVAGGNMMIRRSAFDRAGTFDETISGYWDEREWMLRLVAAGGRVVHIPDSRIVHRRTSDMLRLRHRLRKAYAIGKQEARYLQKVGNPTHGLRKFLGSPRHVVHAVVRRCSGGLVQAATSFGYVDQSVRFGQAPERAART